MAKIVIVPGQFTVQDNKISDGRGFTTQIVPTPRDPNTFLASSYNAMFFYNPMCDYMEWYGVNNGLWDWTSVDAEVLRRKFTTIHELGNYLELNAHDTILAQRQGMNTWQLYFKDKSDRKVFDQFMLEHEPTHIRLSTWPDYIQRSEWNDIVAETTKWCAETLSHKYTLNTAFHELNGFFQNVDDAALFKLKWTTA